MTKHAEIYWDDLTETAQKRLRFLYDENHDIFPLVCIEVEEDVECDLVVDFSTGDSVVVADDWQATILSFIVEDGTWFAFVEDMDSNVLTVKVSDLTHY
jgi:hypothetical protein